MTNTHECFYCDKPFDPDKVYEDTGNRLDPDYPACEPCQARLNREEEMAEFHSLCVTQGRASAEFYMRGG